MTGFPPEALAFYEGLEADNSRAYWAAHRDTYRTAVQLPMEVLLARLAPEFGPARLFRPHRDLRFSRDRSPYRTSAAAAIGDDVQGGLYVALSADGLLLAGGAHGLTTDQARRLRAAVAADAPGTVFAAVLDRLRDDCCSIEGARLARVPREHAAAPRQDLLTLKAVFAVQRHPPQPWLHGPELVDRVAAAWRSFGPLNAWLATHVGPPEVRARPERP